SCPGPGCTDEAASSPGESRPDRSAHQGDTSYRYRTESRRSPGHSGRPRQGAASGRMWADRQTAEPRGRRLAHAPPHDPWADSCREESGGVASQNGRPLRFAEHDRRLQPAHWIGYLSITPPYTRQPKVIVRSTRLPIEFGRKYCRVRYVTDVGAYWWTSTNAFSSSAAAQNGSKSGRS